MAEGSATRDRFFDGRNAVRRAVAPQLVGRTLSINDPDGRAVARWDIDDMRLIERDKTRGSMVFVIASDPNPRLVLFDSPQRAALLAAEKKLRRWRPPPRRRRPIRFAWAVLRLALIALLYFGWCRGIE